MANIKSNNHRKIDCRIIDDVYMDFMLSKDEVFAGNMDESCMAADVNFGGLTGNHVVSDVTWESAKASDTVLENIGYTAVDNGFISYEKDRISNADFVEIYTNSKLDLGTLGDKFFMTKVTGNTQTLTYPVENMKDYTSFKGGFYQGFFKIEGDQYQTLPNKIYNEWNMNFTLRVKDYDTPLNTLNDRHPENKGIFFYIGTRAENKFWELYKSDINLDDYKAEDFTDYCVDCDSSTPKVTGCTYLDGTNTKSANYFEDDYASDFIDPSECSNNGLAIDDEYIAEDISLEDVVLTDSKGHSVNEKGFYEIETDNKFIIFNRTDTGFTINTWDDSNTFIMTGKTDSPNINYFPYLNRTNTGYTINNIDELIEQYTYSYDVFKDIKNNSFALQINDDGSISYRYGILDCEEENSYDVREEKTLPSLIKKDEWVNIHVKFLRLPSVAYDVCDSNYPQGNMKIYIYVNGMLKFVSKTLPELDLRALNDNPERQEGVPYSISIGGGTQGLCERIMLDYYDVTKYELPLEKNFGGSFIGDIKHFSFYNCPLSYSTIYQLGQGF